MNLPEIGIVLREARKRERLTQQQLAAAVGLERSTISLIENGATDIGVRKLERLCLRLGLRIEIAPRKTPTWDEVSKSAATQYAAAVEEASRMLAPVSSKKKEKKRHA